MATAKDTGDEDYDESRFSIWGKASQIATALTNSYQDSGLAANTTYCRRL